jgi:hypothetical protein
MEPFVCAVAKPRTTLYLGIHRRKSRKPLLEPSEGPAKRLRVRCASPYRRRPRHCCAESEGRGSGQLAERPGRRDLVKPTDRRHPSGCSTSNVRRLPMNRTSRRSPMLIPAAARGHHHPLHRSGRVVRRPGDRRPPGVQRPSPRRVGCYRRGDVPAYQRISSVSRHVSAHSDVLVRPGSERPNDPGGAPAPPMEPREGRTLGRASSGRDTALEEAPPLASFLCGLRPRGAATFGVPQIRGSRAETIVGALDARETHESVARMWRLDLPRARRSAA